MMGESVSMKLLKPGLSQCTLSRGDMSMGWGQVPCWAWPGGGMSMLIESEAPPWPPLPGIPFFPPNMSPGGIASGQRPVSGDAGGPAGVGGCRRPGREAL
jgi:hypothetical protein